MGLLGNLIVKGVATAARNSTIKAVGNAAVDVISATSQKQSQEDIVVKNGIVSIKPTRSSQDYLGENTLDVVQELLGVGFEKVTLKPVKKLSEHSVKKYGRIHTISINGNSEFVGIKRIPASSYILIEFLDFKNNVNPEVYKNVKRITSGTISNTDEQESPYHENYNANNSKNFCPYCGEKVINKNSKFCSNCGQKIE
ncbi:MAG: zinc ribbon domain-containing protein [Ruminococcus sp.]